MCYSHWRTLFDNFLLLKRVSPHWNSVRRHDKWSLKRPSGFPKSEEEFVAYAEKNKQYLLRSNTDTRLIVTVSQKDGRYAFYEVFVLV